jgi:hypothetical protein
MVASVALTACGASAAFGQGSGHNGTTPTSTPIASLSGPDSEILSAWLAAQEAFHQAALTSDPDSPGLAATMVDPELSAVRSSLSQLRNAGDVGRGPTYYGSPKVTASGSTSATVVSCAHDEEIAISAATGAPAPGVLGEADFALITSTMLATGGGWKLADQTSGAGKCAAS